MENRLHDTEFEQLLQDETKQHRMYPSDKVWRNIHKEVHGKKSWPALTFLSLMIVAALTVTTILNNHPAQPFENVAKIVVAESNTNQHIPEKKKRAHQQQQSFRSVSDQQVFPILNNDNNEEAATATNLVAVETQSYNPHITVAPTQSPLSWEGMNNMLESNHKNIEREIKQRLGAERTTTYTKDIDATNSTASINPEQDAIKNTKLSVAALQGNKGENKSQFKKPVDDNPSEFDYAGIQSPALLKKNKASRFGFQFYITPSTSYRKLVDDKQRNDYQRVAGSGPAALNYSVSVNDVVRHKPAVGIETGFGFTYKATKKLTIKTGLQFNVRQYYIDAFSSSGIATIAIVSNNKLDTITQFSSFSNTNGYKESKLDTKLFQLSIPVGVQFDILQGRRFGLNIGGSLQPTITMNKNLYIISTDYKAYTDGTPFLRRWNINSSAELNLTYKVGKTQWHIGPQVRYQHLPTYTDIYPIKEYRLDYGVKLGFIKSF